MPTLSIPQAIALALEHHQSGRLQQAEALYRQVLAADPHQPDALHLLGMLAHQAGHADAAIALLQRAIAASASVPDYHSNLGNMLRIAGRFDQAIESCRRALALRPDFPEAWTNLGIALQESGRCDEAIAAYRQSLSLKPGYAATCNNLGVALQSVKRLAEAEACYRRALELDPAYAEACNNLASLRGTQGHAEEAADLCRRSVALYPDSAMLHSRLLYSLEFDPRVDLDELRRQRALWDERFARPLFPQARPHDNDRSPQRRLRIAYSSPALRNHACGWLIAALLAHHDHREFEIVCYSDTRRPDALTARLQSHADLWRQTVSLSDAQFAEQVRQDRIDILVDLQLHLAENRLLAFARKPAPVQVTYLGYPSSTGLFAIDYRLTDACMSPLDSSIIEGPEALVRLPHCYWCYAPPDAAAPVNDLPALKNGRITFASFNHPAKIHAGVLQLWCELLRSVPDSQLLLAITGGQANTHIGDLFQRCGVSPTRLRIADYQDDPAGYFRLYHEADISLDPFPYNGGVTSLDSLYMGVPVVTLAGQRAVSRAGVTLLTHVGLPELIAQTPQQYVQAAGALAADLPALRELRRTLRPRLQQSPIMDGPGFARGVESAYRRMWREWCQRV